MRAVSELAACFVCCVVLGGITSGTWLRFLRPADHKPELRLPCTVSEVYDGDTVTVTLTLTARVRLTDCYAPELDEAGGTDSRDHLRTFALGQPGLLIVDLDGADRLDDVFSFGRILGDVQVKEKLLSQFQIEAGHAKDMK